MKYPSISDFVLFLTFLAILWYSWETRGLKTQIAKQIELSLRPLVLINWISPGKYVLRNIGNGPALAIQLGEIMVVDKPEIKYTFRKIDLMEPKEQRDLEILIGGETATTFDLGAITPHSAVRNFDYCISYTDINGTGYKSAGQVGKVEAIFLRTKRI